MGPLGGAALSEEAVPFDRPVALAASGLSCRFGDLTVLSDVDFHLGPGELVALVGENGAGKSTLIRCLVGALEADSGTVSFEGQPLDEVTDGGQVPGLAVVWQSLALCDNLDAVANLFLGQEWGAPLLSDATMYAEARRLLSDLAIDVPDLSRPVGLLSGGQRQMIAIARAFVTQPRVLLLDEPTAALGVTETRHVNDLLRRLRRSGIAILLVSHRMDQVFELADRIVVMRRGRLVADVSPLEVHPDDVVDLMAGIETDSTARKQLHRLHSLVDQLSEVEPSASLPLIVSAIANALGQPQVCVHLLEPVDEQGTMGLVRRAAVGLPAPIMAVTERLPLGPDGGLVGDAAALARPVVVDDLRVRLTAPVLARAAREAGVVSAWAVPVLGAEGVLGVVSGWSPAQGRMQSEQLELVSLYAGHAAAAIERERLLAEVRRRNHILETLRGVLETLAGPDHLRSGLQIALLALARGLGAHTVALFVQLDATMECRAEIRLGGVPDGPEPLSAALAAAAVEVLAGPDRLDRARPVGADVIAAPFAIPEGRAVLAAWWSDGSGISGDSLDLMDDAARSVRLAIEREALEVVNQEAQALRRSQADQRAFLSRISHELRTPLTAIRGYASSLNQTDVTWDEPAQHRFLDLIATESARMGRLVGDLLDSSALDGGVLRLRSDWCDLALVIEAAAACVPGGTESVEVVVDPGLGPIWGDHDRLEQV
ncbi:MAG TPA: ATP-binding cassette domain-containing protein, partial [Acidimicrobiales bacterium]